MRKTALLYFICNTALFLAPAIVCNAQNPKVVDSLRKEISSHTAKDTSLVILLVNYADNITFENTDSAMKYADNALQLSQTLKWQRGIAISLNQKGMAYYYKSDLVSAMNYFQQALQAGESLQNKSFEALVYSNIANIYADLGQNEKALGFYNKLVDVSREIRNKQFETIALVNIGVIFMDQNDYIKGFAYFRKAFIVAQNTNDLKAAAACLSNMGRLFKNEKEYDSARIYLEESIDMAKKINNKNIEASALTELAEVYMGLDNYNKAEKYSLQSLALAKEVSDVEWQRDAYKVLSNAYEKENQSGKALTAYKIYMTLYDSIMNDKKKEKITRMEMQYQFKQQEDSTKIEYQKQQALAAAKLQQQHIINGSIIGGAGVLLLAGFISFVFYKRNRDIRFMKQISDTELKALRAQIDPHFIGNSLTSISAFIIKNDTQKAIEYLDKFSKLMRSILEKSDQKEVSLADDLDSLEQYMQLQALRMENKFTYEIRVADDIDKDNTLIQQLILQPFVENSIKHGLEKKKGDGKIIISIQQENNMLICSVEDNGIGRKMAEVYKEPTNENERKSLGLKITNARIEIINKLKNTNASVKILDLQQGTKAELKLPLELSF